MALPQGADRNVLTFAQPLHPSVAALVKKTTYKYPPTQTATAEPAPFNDAGIAHFAKLLVSSACLEELERQWALTGETQPVKLPSGSTITTSPRDCHFPGTADRIVCIRGHSFAEIVARAKDVVSACVRVSPVDHAKVGIRIAVPRRVVGTVIGRGGSHIQTLRQMTQATIHISPLFVTSEFACSERVISVSSRDAGALQNATVTLLSLINKHPERASCQRTFYKNGLAPPAAADESLSAQEATNLFQLYAA